jgi:hypothetical protein
MLNRPDAPVKSRFHIDIAGIVLHCGVQHAQHFTALLEPPGNGETGFEMPFKPHRERADAAKCEINVVWAFA